MGREPDGTAAPRHPMPAEEALVSPLELDRCLLGDVRTVLPTLPAGCVQAVVTSPPFWGLRSYLPGGHADKRLEIGMEPSPDCLGWATSKPCGACYVCTMVGVAREIRRVLRDDGTFWLELGDSYFGDSPQRSKAWGPENATWNPADSRGNGGMRRSATRQGSLKSKDLCGFPWRVALALQADGWFLRSDIVWARPNPMPESVQDRPTKSHSYLFLLTKRQTYYYDQEAIREAATVGNYQRRTIFDNVPPPPPNDPPHTGLRYAPGPEVGRNARSVWTIATQPYAGAHFACWPPELVKRCILAGTSEAGCCAACGAPRERERGKMVVRPGPGRKAKQAANGELTRTAVGGTVERPPTSRTIGWRSTCACGAPSVPCVVLDPFMGSGTTAQVAQDLGRRWLGVELNPAYLNLQRERAAQTGLPLLAGSP